MIRRDGKGHLLADHSASPLGVLLWTAFLVSVLAAALVMALAAGAMMHACGPGQAAENPHLNPVASSLLPGYAFAQVPDLTAACQIADTFVDLLFTGVLDAAYAAHGSLYLTGVDNIVDDHHLSTVSGITIFESGSHIYAAVTSHANDGVQILNVTDPSRITAAGSITDPDSLNGARGITTFESGGHIYAAVVAYNNDGVQILNVTDPSHITATDSIIDGGTLELEGATSITTFKSGGHIYAAVASHTDSGVQILNVTDPSDITATDSVTDGGTLEIRGAWGITTFESGDHIYAAVALYDDHGVQILNVTDPSDITAAGSITDGGSLVLKNAVDITTFKSGGHTYAAVASYGDSGVQILNVTDPSDITATDSITDGGSRELNRAWSITTFELDDHIYAAVAAQEDDGVQILDVTNPSRITDAGHIANNGSLELDSARGIATFESGGYTYAAVASYNGNAVQIIRISTVSDITPPLLTLEGPDSVMIIVGTPYIDAGATCVDGVDGPLTPTSTGTVDTGQTETYTVTYSCTDRTGNTAEVSRIVTVGIDTGPDSAPPVFASSILDMATGNLAITFSEEIDAANVVPAKIHVRALRNYVGGVTLTATELVTATDGTVISFILNDEHLKAVAAMNEPKLTIDPGAVRDVSGNLIVGTFETSTIIWVHSISSKDNNSQGIAFSSNGTKMFVIGDQRNQVYEYNLSTPFSISTASFDVATSINDEEDTPTGIAFSSDGTKMFVIGNSDDVNEYNLSTPFNASTRSHVDATSISDREGSPKGIAFSSNGTKMFVIGIIEDDVIEYNLSTPFDASTLRFVNATSITNNESSPRDIAFLKRWHQDVRDRQ